jgi:septal ring factor EnvC (AmiA/AmiB activator)
MSSIVDQAKVYVTLDGRDAETVMAELTAKTEKYTKALTDAYQAGDKLSMKNALKDLKDTEKELTNVQKQTFDVTKVMQNLNGTNLKDLKRAQSEITGELNKMARGTDEFTSKASDLQKVTAEIKKMQTEMKGSGEKGGGPFDLIKEIFT